MPNTFVRGFRESSPYIHQHRGKMIVILLEGDIAEEEKRFNHFIHDIALLNSLGVKVVLVHGCRPQIEAHLAAQHCTTRIIDGWRITDQQALSFVEQAVGQARCSIEAKLSTGLVNTPMAGAHIRVISGNFVTAKPRGIHDGVDFEHTGVVRKVHAHSIQQQLEDNNIVLLSPLGYSPSGETFNLRARDIATQAAIALHADKLIFLQSDDIQRPQLNKEEAIEWLNDNATHTATAYVQSAIEAAPYVQRIHLLDWHQDGILLQELYSRDGQGTLISQNFYEGIRAATVNDLAGIIALIQPLEDAGILMRRDREQLELDIANFMVIERDGMIIACAAIYPQKDSNSVELACLAVHQDYQRQGRGDELLAYIKQIAQEKSLKQLFILTTHTAHWFLERGFVETQPNALPNERRALYNWQRNSKVFSLQLSEKNTQ